MQTGTSARLAAGVALLVAAAGLAAGMSGAVGSGGDGHAAGSAASDGRWHGTPEVWRPPPIRWATMRYADVSGSSVPTLTAALDRAAGPGGAWAWSELRPRRIGCGAVLYPQWDTTHEIVVHVPRWTPAPDGAVSLETVEWWNRMVERLHAGQVADVRTYLSDMRAILDVARALPSCEAVVAYLNDPWTWERLDADRRRVEERPQPARA